MRATIVSGLVMAGWLLVIGGPQAADDKPPTPAEQYQAIVKAYQRAQADYNKAYGEAKTDEEREKVGKELGIKAAADSYAAPMLEVIRNHPKDDAALDAFRWLRAHMPDSKPCDEAVDLVIRHLIEDKRMAGVCQSLGSWGSCRAGDRLLEAAIEKSPHRDVQGFARFALAVSYKREAAWQVNWSAKEREPGEQKAADLFEQVLDKYADLKFGSTALGNKATAALFELRSLGLGKTAPEIEGKDIDGKDLKLSSYRGKVVLVVFWGTWCGPCMSDVPHEQALLKRFESKPFGIVGIDSNEKDRETVKKVCLEKGISWPSFWDGEDAKSHIADRWNISEWPTLYLLDGEGVIRYKGEHLRSRGNRKNKEGKWEPVDYLDEAVDALMKEIAEKRP